MTVEDGPEVIYVEDMEDEGQFRKGRGKVSSFTPEWGEDILAEARKFDLPEREISSGGGWRSDDLKDRYWLDLRQLIEFEKADQRITTDDEFWGWFDQFREDEKLSTGRGKVSWRDNYKGWSEKPKNYLVDWWKGYGYGSKATGDAGKLAIALGAVNSTVNAINDTGKRYIVEFAHDEEGSPLSATSFDSQSIVVSPQAILKESTEDGIEITTGFALHEGSHVKYTEPIKNVTEVPTSLEPKAVSHLMLNVLEDLRIETLTGEKFPGFVSYFEASHNFMWKVQKGHLPTTWGPDLQDKLSAVILMAKWPDEFEPTAMKDPGLAAEWPWWREWAEKYRTGDAEARQSVIDAMDRLRQDPETSKQMDEQTKAEQEAESLAQAISDFLKGMKIKPCDSHHGKDTQISPELSEAVNQFVQENFRQKSPVTRFPNEAIRKLPTITRRKPVEDGYSRSSYGAPRADLVQRMKSAFFFRPKAPVTSDRLLKSGQIDEDELWRAGVGDYRVFEKLSVPETPDVNITMLVDMSGSMRGGRLQEAAELATIMIECLRLSPNTRARVRAHTTWDDGGCYVADIWDQGDPMTRLGLLMTDRSGSNWDGFAIEECAEELLGDQRPNEQMVLIVLSDGLPAGGDGYSGVPAETHVHDTTVEYARKGVQTIQIAVSGDLRPDSQSRMFDHWVPFESPEKLPEQLARLLIKLFRSEEE